MQTITAEQYLSLRVRSWRLYREYGRLRNRLANYYEVDDTSLRSFDKRFWDLNDDGTPFTEALTQLYDELLDLIDA